ncbi:nitrate- and nitrite sensing domain-containing protein [Streptomyces sp. HNM0663]|uniref:histidine kinase n=2 Tax=Streptomyces chengmaiensis TaxID=3040919 RepID=A0ABT6I0V7_9ACTN|nr:nitrate- and nitrite sensing domain-containing protein [Streptomyces chengmaiensis]MDH2394134.1 nitrate- and nitrite sensing domain-containing protein [Streptomyces chengmaiensis]
MTSSAEQQARGNFTPAQRAAASPAEEPSTPATPAAGGSQSPLSPRNWRVPTRLNAILLIPVLVGLVMGGFQVKQAVDTWDEAEQAEKTALIVRAASKYSQALLNERDLTAQPLLTATSEDQRKARVVTDAYSATDSAAAEFKDAIRDMPEGQGLERRLRLFQEEEPKLAKLREAAYGKALDPVATEEGYVQVQHSLMEFSNELGLGTGNVTSFGRTLYAIQLSKAAGSLQRSIGMHLLVRPSEDPKVLAKQTVAFNSYNYLEQIAIAEYVSGGTQEDEDRLKQVMAAKTATGEKQLKAAGLNPPKGADGSVLTGMANQIGQGQTPEDLKAKDITPETWMGAATAKFEGYSQVEAELVDKAVSEASAIADDAKRDAIVIGSAVVIALLAAFILAGLMARQMSRSMRELRTAAFGIAEQRLPMLVDQLSRTEPGRVDTRVQPIPIDSQDEIGEVARAFDQVHREAVRLAAEQAMLRGNVNAIFTNLSRRNQSLIEGQLTLITDLENNEADPDQLENLFKLDHLATRMRRNGENLLVLAGEEPGRRWDQPVPLVDVMRAASSEVEQYERIELSGVPEADIHGRAVTDLVHLLAELLENATTFSSPQTKVRVTATRLPDGRVMIEIHDKGIGLTAEDFADINHKLANPPTVDAAVSQRMGLFVVGRLADRHGIRVQLRPSGEQAGTTSLVMLPDEITHGGGGMQLPEDDFTVSQMIPEQHSYETEPMRTAAELGFDDSRYENADGDERQLDPVGRSLIREERRAALEAQAHAKAGDAEYGQEQQYDAEYGEDASYEDSSYQGSSYQESSYQESSHPDGRQEYGQEGSFGQEQSFGQEGSFAPEQQYQAYQQDYGQQEYQEYQGGQSPQQPYDGLPSPNGSGPGQGGAYQEQQQAAYAEADFQAPQDSDGQYSGSYDSDPHQAKWPDQSGYQDSYEPDYRTESESGPGAPADGSDRVGFNHPGTAPSSGHELTDAGLPRRGSSQQSPPPQQQPQQAQDQQQWQQPAEQAPGAAQSGRTEANGSANGSGSGADPEGWRSVNDQRWQRAEKLRDPKAGGVTPSGLPRRVPKANLVEGTAEQTPQAGPQVSRAPEDVRGRLSNLRRGVQRGRSAGTDTNGSGLGPGSTYNQER